MKIRAVLLGAALIATGILALRQDDAKRAFSRIPTAMQRLTGSHLPLPYEAPPPSDQWQALPPAERLASVRARLQPQLNDLLRSHGLQLGQPVYLRIFKESRELELWMKTAESAPVWKLFRTYPIAAYSGTLGPKMREGDRQAPEGFYDVVPQRLNPASSYHLSFNIGYPNAYDLAHQRTGSYIMVHGSQVSVGCFAMTDPLIEEIYLLVEAALHSGTESLPIHSFPFRMTPARMQQARDEASPHLAFWQELQPAYTAFENAAKPPQVQVNQNRYELAP